MAAKLPRRDAARGLDRNNTRYSFAASFEDYDIALGCECADPALQIERWNVEAREAAGQAN